MPRVAAAIRATIKHGRVLHGMFDALAPRKRPVIGDQHRGDSQRIEHGEPFGDYQARIGFVLGLDLRIEQGRVQGTAPWK